MLKIYLCEDDEKHRAVFQKFIEEVIMIEDFDMAVELALEKPKELLEAISKRSESSIYFLDVNLNADISGLQLASEIRKTDPRGYIVFISSHAEMSSLTFQYKVEALDYIIKDKYVNIKNRIHECLININEKHYNRTGPQKKDFVVKSQRKLISEAFENILFFEVSDNVHRVIMNSYDRSVEFYATIKEVQNNLDNRFYRCNSNCIVNKDHISEVDIKNKIILLKNGMKCYPSNRLLKGLLNEKNIIYINSK